MCCLLAILAVLGPRALILVWWLADQVLWARAFDNFIVPLLGFLFLPWTTIAYVLVFPGGVDGFDYVWLGLAVLFDIVNIGGGAYGNRGRFMSASNY